MPIHITSSIGRLTDARLYRHITTRRKQKIRRRADENKVLDCRKKSFRTFRINFNCSSQCLADHSNWTQSYLYSFSISNHRVQHIPSIIIHLSPPATTPTTAHIRNWERVPRFLSIHSLIDISCSEHNKLPNQLMRMTDFALPLKYLFSFRVLWHCQESDVDISVRSPFKLLANFRSNIS